MRALSAQKDTTATLQIDTSAHCAGAACILPQRVLLASRHAKSVLPARGRLLGVPAAILVLITPFAILQKKSCLPSRQFPMEALRRELAKAILASNQQGLSLGHEAEEQAHAAIATAVSSPSGRRGPADGLSRTPEAIRSSRRLRQSHEVFLLAGLDAKEDAAGMVSQRLLALRQRRRELARALEHLEAVAPTAAPQPALAARTPAPGSWHQSPPADAEMDASSLEDAHSTEGLRAGSAHSAVPDASRVITESTNASVCWGSESVQGGEEEGGGEEGGEEDAVNTLMQPASFDVLVQSLLRASLADHGCQRDGLEADARTRTCPVGDTEAAVGAHGAHAITSNHRPGAVDDGVRLPSTCSALAAGACDCVSRLSCEEASLTDLLRSRHHVTGLLRPQDIHVPRCSTSGASDAGSLLQLQHARLCAAAALERAHELVTFEEGCNMKRLAAWEEKKERGHGQGLPPQAEILKSPLYSDFIQ
jgi:hypothetical protein